LNQLHVIAISFVSGCLVTAVFIRYGMSLGTNIVRRTQEGLPAFGKDEPVMTQINTIGMTDEEEDYEDEQ